MLSSARIGQVALPRKSTSGASLLLVDFPNDFAPKTQSVTALPSAESELYAIGTCAGEVLHARSLLMDTKVVNPGNGLIFRQHDCGHFGHCQEDTTYTASVFVYPGAMPDGDHEASQGAWRAKPLRHPHPVCQYRCSSETLASFHHDPACDEIFNIAFVFVMQSDCEHFQHGVVLCASARASCSDVTSASSPQPPVSWMSLALVEPYSPCGTSTQGEASGPVFLP